MNRSDFQDNIFMQLEGDSMDVFRREYNDMLYNLAIGSKSIVHEKYVTVSIQKKSIDDARMYFQRIGTELSNRFRKLGSTCTGLTVEERVRILYDFFHDGNGELSDFNLLETMRRGHSFKDTICPDSFAFHKDHFRMGDKYARVLYLRDYGSYIGEDLITKLCALEKNSMLSIDIMPAPMEEAVREVERLLLGVETNIVNWQRKQNQNGNFSANIPLEMEQQREELKSFMYDLASQDQRMLLVLTIVHTADSMKELDSDTEAILNAAAEGHCQCAVLNYQQLDGLNTVLPYGLRQIDNVRTLTSGSLAVLTPFHVQEVQHPGGIYYGQNTISNNMILVDRKGLMNGNSFILGVSGSGKSFTAKEEMLKIILFDPNADVLVIDPEREYYPLVKALGGEVIPISASSHSHINAMDINAEYGEGANPVILKSEFILSLCEHITDLGTLGAKQKSIIDRCTAAVYHYYQQGNYMGIPPTLQDFREELLRQQEPEAKALALELEIFTNGSLNTFAQNTNVDTQNRMICYDILDLSEQLQPIGMLVVLDSILNRITLNRSKGRNTYILLMRFICCFSIRILRISCSSCGSVCANMAHIVPASHRM